MFDVQRRMFSLGLILGLAALPAIATPAKAAAIPADGKLDFTVYRDGDEVGSSEILFRQSGNQTEVDVVTDIVVTVAFVPVYRFEQEAHEVWKDGQLVSMVSQTNDDGTAHQLEVRDSGDTLDVIGDGVSSKADKSIIPASLWNPETVQRSMILNSLSGGELAVQVAFVGEETIAVKGDQVPARHYSMTGQFERELWYDNDGVLVRIEFKGQDGSDIQYVIE
jgi:Domain of unknown function (DUF6134)